MECPITIMTPLISGYCIEVHTKAAKGAGASREEIVESSLLAAALRAGGAATHGAMALKFYDKA